MLPILEQMFSFFYRSRTPPHQFVHDKIDYHPIYGFPGKVDNPKQRVKTHLGQKIPWTDHLINTHLGHHFINTPVYKKAWEERKRGSYYNVGKLEQLSPYQYRPIIEKRRRFLSGGEQSSRNFPNTEYMRPNFYTQMKNSQKTRNDQSYRTLIH